MLFLFSSDVPNIANTHSVCYFLCEKHASTSLWRLDRLVGTNFDPSSIGLPDMAMLTDVLYSLDTPLDLLALNKKIVAVDRSLFFDIYTYIENNTGLVLVSETYDYITNMDQLVIQVFEDEFRVVKYMFVDYITRVFTSSIPWNAMLSFNMLMSRVQGWVVEGKVTLTVKNLAETNMLSQEVITYLSLDGTVNEDIKEYLLNFPTLQIVDIQYDSFSQEEMLYLAEYMRKYNSVVEHYLLFLDSVSIMLGCETEEALFSSVMSCLLRMKDSVVRLG